MFAIDYAELPSIAGRDLGCTEWLTIEQARVDNFASATDDHQWIHTDIDRATRERGGTIVHGFLTLSLLPSLMDQLLRVDGTSHMLNMGTNRVRFTSPVPVGAKVRLQQRIKDVTPRAGGFQVVHDCTIEIETEERPACVIESVMLYLP